MLTSEVLRDPGLDDLDWLNRDWKEHRRNLNKWLKEVRMPNGLIRMSSKDSEIAVPHVDFPVKKGLCPWTASNINYNWWQKNLSRADDREYEEAKGESKIAVP